MEDNKYLETINKLSNTIKELAVEKERKVNGYKTIIIALVIALTIVSTLYACSINYFIRSVYGYDYTVTNENTNTNTNTNKNGGDN